jgi:hypothetical protein
MAFSIVPVYAFRLGDRVHHEADGRFESWAPLEELIEHASAHYWCRRSCRRQSYQQASTREVSRSQRHERVEACDWVLSLSAQSSSSVGTPAKRDRYRQVDFLISMKRRLVNLTFFCCFFPFLKPLPVRAETQPVAGLVALLIILLYRARKSIYSITLPWFMFIIAGYYAISVVVRLHFRANPCMSHYLLS